MWDQLLINAADRNVVFSRPANTTQLKKILTRIGGNATSSTKDLNSNAKGKAKNVISPKSVPSPTKTTGARKVFETKTVYVDGKPRVIKTAVKTDNVDSPLKTTPVKSAPAGKKDNVNSPLKTTPVKSLSAVKTIPVKSPATVGKTKIVKFDGKTNLVKIVSKASSVTPKTKAAKDGIETNIFSKTTPAKSPSGKSISAKNPFDKTNASKKSQLTKIIESSSKTTKLKRITNVCIEDVNKENCNSTTLPQDINKSKKIVEEEKVINAGKMKKGSNSGKPKQSFLTMKAIEKALDAI